MAHLYDSVDNDWLIARPRYGWLYSSQFANKAIGFRGTHAYSDTGGTDTAFLYDSALLDHLKAARKEEVGTWVQLSCVDPSAGPDDLFTDELTGFELVKASSQNEGDTKEIDASAADWLVTEGWD